MSHDLLIHELSSKLTPVHRRNMVREMGWLASLGALELAVFLAFGMMRPDMARVIGHPFMWWKLGSPAALAVVGCLTAVRSFSPMNSPRRGLVLIAVLIGLTMMAGAMVGPGDAVASTLSDRLLPAYGVACAGCIVVLSLPISGMLAIIMRKGASAHAEASALAVGLAGGSWGAFVFAFCCRVNDPLYVVVWYSVGCAVATLIARLMLPRYAAL